MKEERVLQEGTFEVADTSWKRALGLMFRKNPTPLLIVFPWESRHAIWMLFMRFSIDLVFLDSHNKVVTIHEGIKPISLDPRTWRIYRPEKPAKYALELGAGWVKSTRLAKGDILKLGELGPRPRHEA